MRRSLAACGVCLGAALLQAQTQPPQVFRTGTDLVMVDVSVRDGGRAVLGLTADDFVLTDNGVRQRIDSVEAASVPIDVTLVVDLSGHPGGTWAKPSSRTKIATELRHEVGEVVKILRSDDRLRLLAIDTSVHQVFGMQPVSSLPAIERFEFDGMSSLYEGLVAALLQPVEPARRHVVIARTKGNDTISSIGAPAAAAVAEQADALFHLVLMESAGDEDAAVKQFQCQWIGLCLPTRQFWMPFRRRLAGGRPRHELTPDGQLLAHAAAATGGALHKTQMIKEPTLTGTFKKAFEDFRTSYVLRYTLQGVAPAGWHRIDVRVPRSNKYTVRARRGYLVEPPTSPPAPRPLPATLARLDDFTTAYERRAFSEVVLGLRAAKSTLDLIKDFEEAGNPWPANPKIEAAFALELTEAGIFSPDAPTRAATVAMVDRIGRLVRHPLEPDIFERYWYFAALTIYEGALRPLDTLRLAARALERVPDEPRFILSRAIAADQSHAARASAPLSKEPLPDLGEIAGHYLAALKHPDIAAEAAVRYAYFLHRTNRSAAALEYLDGPAASSTADISLRYLRQLFRGHILSRLERPDEAAVAYREARAIVPGAQSSRVALMNLLLLSGDRAGAEALAEEVQSATSWEDPWWNYWLGQYRFNPQAMARVRELSR